MLSGVKNSTVCHQLLQYTYHHQTKHHNHYHHHHPTKHHHYYQFPHILPHLTQHHMSFWVYLLPFLLYIVNPPKPHTPFPTSLFSFIVTPQVECCGNLLTRGYSFFPFIYFSPYLQMLHNMISSTMQYSVRMVVHTTTNNATTYRIVRKYTFTHLYSCKVHLYIITCFFHLLIRVINILLYLGNDNIWIVYCRGTCVVYSEGCMCMLACVTWCVVCYLSFVLLVGLGGGCEGVVFYSKTISFLPHRPPYTHDNHNTVHLAKEATKPTPTTGCWFGWRFCRGRRRRCGVGLLFLLLT